MQDLRFAVRTLQKQPWLACAVVATLEFGIATTTAMAVAVMTLTAAVLVASSLSARRALSIDPAENLRAN